MAALKNAAAADADEAVLISRCRAGDRFAFRELYDRHFDMIHGLARRLGTPSAELDDVTQEVFSNAFNKLARFGEGNFTHWIHSICANVVTDHHRKRRVRDAFRSLWRPGRDPETEYEPNPERLLARAQAEHQVAQILERMRPKHREVFALFELEGLSGEEIAARVSCPVNTVWTRLYHARRAFVSIGARRGWIVGPE
jgi:RNA polymerase sigma-70 factor, ECF subfamily